MGMRMLDQCDRMGGKTIVGKMRSCFRIGITPSGEEVQQCGFGGHEQHLKFMT